MDQCSVGIQLSTAVFPATLSADQGRCFDGSNPNLMNGFTAVNDSTNRYTSAIDNNQTPYTLSGPIPHSVPLGVTGAINPNGGTTSSRRRIKYDVSVQYKNYPLNKFPITSTTTVEEIKRKAVEPFNLEEGSFIISYIDSAGDIIFFWRQENLKEALKIARRSSNGVKKTVFLYITLFGDYGFGLNQLV